MLERYIKAFVTFYKVLKSGVKKLDKDLDSYLDKSGKF